MWEGRAAGCSTAGQLKCDVQRWACCSPPPPATSCISSTCCAIPAAASVIFLVSYTVTMSLQPSQSLFLCMNTSAAAGKGDPRCDPHTPCSSFSSASACCQPCCQVVVQTHNGMSPSLEPWPRHHHLQSLRAWHLLRAIQSLHLCT